MPPRRAPWALFVLATLAAGAPAGASPKTSSEPLTVAVPIPGSSLVHGRSTLFIPAPIERVRATILDFPRYPEFMPHYRAARVLGRTASGGRDVYMEVEALHGVVKLWARVEVPAARVEGGIETYKTRFVDGNVRDLQAIWRLKRLDAASTEVELEVFLLPKIPLPDGILNGENVGGSRSAVLALRKRLAGS